MENKTTFLNAFVSDWNGALNEEFNYLEYINEAWHYSEKYCQNAYENVPLNSANYL